MSQISAIMDVNIPVTFLKSFEARPLRPSGITIDQSNDVYVAKHRGAKSPNSMKMADCLQVLVGVRELIQEDGTSEPTRIDRGGCKWTLLRGRL